MICGVKMLYVKLSISEPNSELVNIAIGLNNFLLDAHSQCVYERIIAMRIQSHQKVQEK